ncbi:MAG: phosphoribosylformylglycinamidine synthase subunit PurQ [Desulfotignum sp.]
MTQVKALILTGFGLNCDHETALAFELAGAEPHRVHINSLVAGTVNLADFQVLAFGGGFSWGDDHGAGVIQAVKLKNHIGGDLLSFVDAGKLIIGICNGFQALVNLGLLPGLNSDYTQRSVAITYNDCGNFRDQWVHLAANPESPCVFTKGIDRADFPVRHGEGKFIADPDVVTSLQAKNQVVFQYADGTGNPANGMFPLNPNGSEFDIAGICDPTGNIFGLMPHPEAYNHITNHPDWTLEKQRKKRLGQSFDAEETLGVRLFRNGVDHIRERFL